MPYQGPMGDASSNLGRTSQGAYLPDFNRFPNAGDNARAFMDNLYYPLLPRYATVQLRVGASLICLLEVIVGAILLRRLYDRSFWLFRLGRKANGTILIPNALVDFSLMAGLYGFLLIAMCWQLVGWFGGSRRRPDYWMFWIVCTWIPLAPAAHLAAVGTHYARPRSSSDANVKGGMMRFLTHPLLLNAYTLLLPGAVAVSVIIPAVIAHFRWMPALRDYEAWQQTYRDAAQVSPQMASSALDLYERVVRAYLTVLVGMWVWAAWAILIGAEYVVAGYRLLTVIGRQITRLERSESRNRVRVSSLLPMRIVASKKSTSEARATGTAAAAAAAAAARGAGPLETDAVASTLTAEHVAAARGSVTSPVGGPRVVFEKDDEKDGGSGAGGSDDQEMGDSLRYGGSVVGQGGLRPPSPTPFHQDDTIRSVRLEAPPVAAGQRYDRRGSTTTSADGNAASQHTRSGLSRTGHSRSGHTTSSGDDTEDEDEQRRRQLFTNKEMRTDDPTSTFFPPVRPSRIVAHRQALKPASSASGDRQGFGYLYSIYRHVLIQFLAIAPAIYALCAVAFYLSIGGVIYLRKNQLERLITVAILTALWTSCVFGAVTLVGIAQRTYEPVFNMSLTTHTGGRPSGEGDGATGAGGKKRRSARGAAAAVPREKRDAAPDHAVTTWFESQTVNGRQGESILSNGDTDGGGHHHGVHSVGQQSVRWSTHSTPRPGGDGVPPLPQDGLARIDEATAARGRGGRGGVDSLGASTAKSPTLVNSGTATATTDTMSTSSSAVEALTAASHGALRSPALDELPEGIRQDDSIPPIGGGGADELYPIPTSPVARPRSKRGGRKATAAAMTSPSISARTAGASSGAAGRSGASNSSHGSAPPPAGGRRGSKGAGIGLGVGVGGGSDGGLIVSQTVETSFEERSSLGHGSFASQPKTATSSSPSHRQPTSSWGYGGENVDPEREAAAAARRRPHADEYLYTDDGDEDEDEDEDEDDGGTTRTGSVGGASPNPSATPTAGGGGGGGGGSRFFAGGSRRVRTSSATRGVGGQGAQLSPHSPQRRTAAAAAASASASAAQQQQQPHPSSWAGKEDDSVPNSAAESRVDVLDMAAD